jgi:hypothetical protein
MCSCIWTEVYREYIISHAITTIENKKKDDHILSNKTNGEQVGSFKLSGVVLMFSTIM